MAQQPTWLQPNGHPKMALPAKRKASFHKNGLAACQGNQSAAHKRGKPLKKKKDIKG
jgi:hypothetical protein